MSTRMDRKREKSTYAATARQPDRAHGDSAPDTRGGHGGHRLMMIVCCVPMLLIAVTLVLTGVAGSGIIVTAVLCTAMMAAMMFAMPGGHDHN